MLARRLILFEIIDATPILEKWFRKVAFLLKKSVPFQSTLEAVGGFCGVLRSSSLLVQC